MGRVTSPLTKSWKMAAQGVLLGVGLTAASFFILRAGLGENTLVLILFGGACLITGPALVWLYLTGKRGGYGPCPFCHTSIKAYTGDAKNLLCGGCGAYLNADEDRLVSIETERTPETPFFAAPTPWTDVFNVVSPGVPLSFDDYLRGTIEELIEKKAGVRLLGAHWPDGCCVCGQPATRKDGLAVKVKLAGRFRDTSVTLVASDIPYCAQHKDGIAFDRVSFDSPGLDMGYGILFRSLSYREAFRRMNAWQWAGVSPAALARYRS
jgi:hypothetical protein